MVSNKVIIFSAAGFIILSGCAHEKIKKADIAETANPVQEIQTMDSKLKEAEARQVDLLAPYYYKKSSKALREAQDDFQSKQSNREILEDVAYAQAYLSKAEEAAILARKDLGPALQARQGAVNAQAHVHFPKKLNSIDKDLKDLSEEYEEKKIDTATSKEVSEVQDDYTKLEAESLKETQLGKSAALIKKAKNNGAKRYAPHVLEEAEIAYNNAEKVIETDRNNTLKVQTAVQQANSQAERVDELTEVARQYRDKSPEEMALAIERKNQDLQARNLALAAEQSRVTQAQSALEETHSNLMASKEQLSKSKEDVSKLQQKEEFQQAIEASRKSFKPSEAEAYQQGSALLIRLKSLNFASNRAELPKTSYETLRKVKEVVGKMGPAKIVIEGHTDSIGSTDVNQKLSEARAETVKSYFVSENIATDQEIETTGMGSDEPISTNKTPAGRSQNRRVDILIEPISEATAVE